MQERKIILADLPGLGRIMACSCGAIHVNVGPVTLNLDPQAFAQLTALMNTALEQQAHQSRAKADNSASAFCRADKRTVYVH